MKSKIRFYIVLFIMLSMSIPVCFSHSNIITTTAEYEIMATEDKNAAENIAYFSALRDAVEQICVIVQSETKTKNMNVTSDVIYATSAAVVQVLDKKVDWVSKTKVRITLKSTPQMSNIDSLIDKCMNDAVILMQYKRLNDNINKLKSSIKQKKKDLNTATDNIKKDEISDDIKNISQEFLSTIWFEKALTQHIVGLDDDAFISLDTALSFDPDYANAYALKGSIYDDIGNYDLALKEYDNALKLNPDYPEVLHGIGYLYKKQHKYDMALEYLNRALTVDPYLTPTYNLRASIYALLDMQAKAIQDYERVLHLNYQDYDALVGMAMAQREIGRYDIAYRYAEKAIRVYPRGSNGYMARGMALAFMGHLSEAINSFDLAIKYEKDTDLRNGLIGVRNALLNDIKSHR